MPNNRRLMVSARPGAASDQPARGDALERLYAYWLLSTVFLLAIGIAFGLIMMSRQNEQAQLLRASQERQEELQQQVRALEARVASLRPIEAPHAVSPSAKPAETPRAPAFSQPASQPAVTTHSQPASIPAATVPETPADHVRAELQAGHVVEALAAARRLVDEPGHAPENQILLAEALAGVGDIDSTAELNQLLDGFTQTTRLSDRDAVQLARLLAVQQRWSDVSALLDTRLAKADAIWDPDIAVLHCIVDLQSGGTALGLKPVRDGLAELSRVRPDDHWRRLWLGVAQMQAGAYADARTTLQFVEKGSTAADEWYWRGLLEVNAGEAQTGQRFLEQAIALGPGYAPAWEALGTLAINRGDWADALAALNNAIRANPGRAGAHFLLAVVHAAGGRREEAAKSLSAALRLDGSLAGAARKVESLKKMFDEREIQKMAATQPAE